MFGISNFIILSYILPFVSDSLLLLISYFVSIIQSHITQRVFVWKSRSRYLPELLRFSTAYLIQFFVNICLLAWTGKVFEFTREARQTVIIVLLTLVMFRVNQKGVFRDKI
jgi:putative flippase GtrA